jgi:hypothetical protein
MSKHATKERLFEVTGRLDKTFRTKLNEEVLPTPNAPRPLYQIAKEIRQDWKNVYFGAVPYLQAMMSLNSIDDNYGMDSAKSIVLYFLSNASTWRGENAKRIKSELKKMAGLKEEFMREEDEVAPENLAVSPVGGVVEEGGLNEASSISPIHNYVYFAFNFPSDFIKKAWAEDPNIAKHLEGKFSEFYSRYGANGVMNKFYTELDGGNQKKLEDWIMANYHG